MLLTGYEPDVLRGNTNYKPSGLIGDTQTYADYKNDLAEKREKMRQKMFLLKDSERAGIDREQGYGVKVERGLEMLSRLTSNN